MSPPIDHPREAAIARFALTHLEDFGDLSPLESAAMRRHFWSQLKTWQGKPLSGAQLNRITALSLHSKREASK